MLKTLKEKILGTEAQNKKAEENMKNNPMEKKFQKMMGNEPKEEAKNPDGETVYDIDGTPGTFRPATKEEIDGAFKRLTDKKSKGKKAGGIIKSSASKRADGCAVRGKTRA